MSRAFKPLMWLLFASLANACSHEGRAPSPYTPVARLQPAAAVVLAETQMQDPKNWEHLLDAFVLLGGEDELLQWLPEAAVHLDAQILAKDASARQLTVQAVYRMVQVPNFAKRFATIRALVDGLQAAAPQAPETIFARAYLRWVLLTDGRGHLDLRGLERSIALDLHRDLETLVRKHPQFDGPGDFSHARLERELAAATRLLATPETPAAEPGSATPTVAPSAVTPVAP